MSYSDGKIKDGDDFSAGGWGKVTGITSRKTHVRHRDLQKLAVF